MALIPLRQTVVITPLGGYDPDYNEPIPGTPYMLKCRFQEGVKLVRNRYGQEVASIGTFYFDKLTPIKLSDKITYVNENEDSNTYDPISIGVKRSLGGKPLLTEVNV